MPHHPPALDFCLVEGLAVADARHAARQLRWGDLPQQCGHLFAPDSSGSGEIRLDAWPPYKTLKVLFEGGIG